MLVGVVGRVDPGAAGALHRGPNLALALMAVEIVACGKGSPTKAGMGLFSSKFKTSSVNQSVRSKSHEIARQQDRGRQDISRQAQSEMRGICRTKARQCEGFCTERCNRRTFLARVGQDMLEQIRAVGELGCMQGAGRAAGVNQSSGRTWRTEQGRSKSAPHEVWGQG